MRAEKHQPREVLDQAHHAQGGFDGDDLLFKREPGSRNALLLARRLPAIDSVLPAEFVEKRRQLFRRQVGRLGGVAQEGLDRRILIQGALP